MTDDWEEDEPDEGDDDLANVACCAACGEKVYEDAEQCPHCGEYVVHSTSAFADRPLWFCLLGVLGVVATIICLWQ